MAKDPVEPQPAEPDAACGVDSDPIAGAPYEVGYGRPPLKTRFKPGQIGNPAGRPKGAKSLKTRLAEELEQQVAVIENGKTKHMSKGQIGIKKMVNNFVQKGDLRTFQLFLELDPGRATDAEESRAGATSASNSAIIAHYLNDRLKAGEQNADPE